MRFITSFSSAFLSNKSARVPNILPKVPKMEPKIDENVLPMSIFLRSLEPLILNNPPMVLLVFYLPGRLKIDKKSMKKATLNKMHQNSPKSRLRARFFQELMQKVLRKGAQKGPYNLKKHIKYRRFLRYASQNHPRSPKVLQKVPKSAPKGTKK